MDLQMKSTHKFIVFAIKDKLVQVETVGDSESTYEDFLKSLPANDCRYAVYKMSFTKPASTDGLNEGRRTKTVFVLWAPGSANIKDKFVYSASKESLKWKLQGGLNIEIQAGKVADLSEQQMLDKCLALTK